MTTSALETAALTKRYGRISALTDVTLTIPTGAITALIGPNAAGKSTMIKCWLGFERPTGGSTRVAGRDPVADQTAVLGEVGYLAQGAPLYPDLTVSDHLALARGLRPSFDVSYARARVDQLQIPDAVAAGRLSGGQQAQLALAIVLATYPSVLLLDEPLASLDPLARREFLNLLVEVAHREGQTVLLSSHIVSDIEHACDAVIVLGGGQLLLAASVADALAGHIVGPLAGVHQPRIGLLPAGPVDTPTALYRGSRLGTHTDLRTPTLEELVLGYLASGRAEGLFTQ